MTTATAPSIERESSSTAGPIPVRFHLSLNVSDLPQAVAFFERVLGVPPAKKRADYAKFELDSPPLVFSLEPRSPGLHGSLNHVGFRFADAATLVDVQRRLEQVGIRTEREEGVECCYAKQTKFWVNDLDHRLWEFYVLEGDIDHRGAGQAVEKMLNPDALPILSDSPSTAANLIIYEHYMGQPFAAPDQCDEIRLRGSFNVPSSPDDVRNKLEEVKRHLKPGGKIHLHQLTSDVTIADSALNLPGRASVVKHVPVRADLLQALRDAGFQQLALIKFGSTPCFNLDGIELRETIIEARLTAESNDNRFDVVYKGPFASIQDDAGRTYSRGDRVSVNESTWSGFEAAGVAGQFTRLAAPSVVPIACGK